MMIWGSILCKSLRLMVEKFFVGRIFTNEQLIEEQYLKVTKLEVYKFNIGKKYMILSETNSPEYQVISSIKIIQIFPML